MKDKLIKRQGLNIIGLFILIVVALFTINNIVVMAKIDTTNYLYLNAIQDSIIWNSIKLSIIVYCTFLLTLKVNSNFKLLESINQTRSVRKAVKVSDIGNSTATNECTIPTDKFSKFSTDDLFMAKDIEYIKPKVGTDKTRSLFTPIDKTRLQSYVQDNITEKEVERNKVLYSLGIPESLLEGKDKINKDESEEENEGLDDTIVKIEWKGSKTISDLNDEILEDKELSLGERIKRMVESNNGNNL